MSDRIIVKDTGKEVFLPWLEFWTDISIKIHPPILFLEIQTTDMLS